MLLKIDSSKLSHSQLTKIAPSNNGNHAFSLHLEPVSTTYAKWRVRLLPEHLIKVMAYNQSFTKS